MARVYTDREGLVRNLDNRELVELDNAEIPQKTVWISRKGLTQLQNIKKQM